MAHFTDIKMGEAISSNMNVVKFLLVLVFLNSCSNSNEFTGAWTWGGSVGYEEPKNSEFISKLKSRDIEYITDSRGFVTYRLRDLAKVRMIMDSIEGRDNDRPTFGKTYVQSGNTGFISLFEKRAKEINIRVEFQNSSYPYFMWEFENREKIYQLEQDIKFELLGAERAVK